MNKVTRFGKLSLLTLLVGITGLTSLKAQDPVPMWSVNAPKSNWFLNDNNTRGLGFNPATNRLIVASRSGGLKAVLLDAASGDSVGVLSTTGISGGTFPYHHIRATSDGQIFASNLVVANTSNLKVYRWANETSDPTVIFDGATTAAVRTGDSFQVVGSGNNVSVLISGSSSTVVVKISWDGTTGTKTEYTIPAGKARGGFSSAVNDSTVWISGTGTAPAPFNFKTGAVGADLVPADLTALPAATFNSVMTNDAAKFFGVNYLIAGPAFTGGKFYVMETATGKKVKEFGPIGNNTNTNNTGGVIIDKKNSRVYVMDSNNSIKAYWINDLMAGGVFSESFDYAKGSLLTANGWTAHSGTGTNSIPVDSISLAYPGYAGAGGKTARLVASGEDVNRSFGENITDGEVYAAFMINVSKADAVNGGEYFFHFVNSQGTGAEFRGRVSVKEDANGKLAFGISKGSGASSSTYSAFDYDKNKTHLVVVEYVRVAGASNDKVNLYVNPIGSVLPATPTVTAADETTISDIIELTNIAIRQGTNSPAALIGGIRVGANYDVVVGNPEDTRDFDVTFQIDMRDPIKKKNFVRGTHAVTVAGAFNDWSNRKDTLKDADGDSIYTKTMKIKNGTYGWKFVYSSRQFQPLEWEGDPGRELVVNGANVNTGVLTPQNITFNDFANTNFDKIAVQFQLNMQVQILKGAFNKATDVAEVRGNFNGWSGGTKLTEGATPNVFEAVVKFNDFPLGTNLVYKFTTTVAGATNWESPNNNNPDNNRIFTVEDRTYTDAERLDGYAGIFLNADGEAPFFSDITNNDIFTSTGTALFEVDLRPAFYFLADSSKLPADVQNTDTTSSIRGLFANGPLLNTGAGGWEAWGEASLGKRADLRLYDDGTNGDKKAGDSLYSRAFTFAPGRDKIGPYKFGINGIDNEAFAGENHRVRLEDGAVVRDIYGAIKLSNGTIYKALYDPYIGVDGDRIYVKRRANGSEIPNSVEGESAIPTRFALSQNYPNPFNPTTTINFELAKSTNVTLSVYNVLGQRVATLINGQAMNAGTYNFNFDASKLASGMYIYRIQAGSFTATKTMTLIK